MPNRAPSPRSVRAGAAGVVLALALLPWLAVASARAATLEVPQGTGLTEPAGLVETPDGGLWITDATRGVCRLRPGANPAPVASSYRGVPVAEEGPERAGPQDAFQIAFDPETSYFYVAEGSSAAGGVWRMRWNPLNGAIDTAVKIADTPGDRAFALALGRTGPPLVPGGPATNEVYFATRDSDAIAKVTNPTGLVPAVQPFGVAQRSGSSALAWLDGQLYIADGSLVSRISTAAGAPRNATAVSSLAVPFPSALAADRANGRLYVGTDSGALHDSVDVLVSETGLAETYDSGFVGIGALGTGRDGSLLVGDDPVAATGAVGAEGNGRVWRAPFSAVNLAGVAITDGPPTYTNQLTATFSYSSRAGASFECRLDGSAWDGCPGDAEGSISYDALSEATHSFEVRAVDATGPGRAAQRTFVVDTTAPDATIDNPDSDRTPRGDSLALSFSSGETQASFTCSLDGTDAEPCRSPRRYSGLSLGEHTVRVSATDAAGNPSDPADPRSAFSFVVEPAPAPQPLPPREAPRPAGVDQAAAPATSPLEAGRTAVDPPTVLRPSLALLRAQRLTRRGGRAVLAAEGLVRIRRGGVVSVSWKLRPGQLRRLRPGRHLLQVQAGPTRSLLATKRLERPIVLAREAR